MTKTTNAFGELGERVAARWLERAGYSVLARRWRSGHRDIDLIAARDGVVAFVEVKTRAGLEFGDPVEAVNVRKQRSLIRCAREWVAKHERITSNAHAPTPAHSHSHSPPPPIPMPTYRFDVIGVLLNERRAWVRHVEGAFEM